MSDTEKAHKHLKNVLTNLVHNPNPLPIAKRCPKDLTDAIQSALTGYEDDAVELAMISMTCAMLDKMSEKESK